MRTKLRPVALATDLPSEVLPTAGGPTRHRIGPFSFFMRCWTARDSRLRSFTFSSPNGWALRTRSAALMWRLIVVRLDHGSDANQSRYLRPTLAAAVIVHTR